MFSNLGPGPGAGQNGSAILGFKVPGVFAAVACLLLGAVTLAALLMASDLSSAFDQALVQLAQKDGSRLGVAHRQVEPALDRTTGPALAPPPVRSLRS